jgi:hypothetical protein
MGLLSFVDRFRGIPKWRRVAIGTAVALPTFLLASLLPLLGSCVPWDSPLAASFYMQASFPALILGTWYVFLVGGYLYSALVITAVKEWATDTRRPVSILVGGTVIYFLGPAFTLAADTCGAGASQLIVQNFFGWGVVQLFAQWFSFLDDVPQLNGIMFTGEAIRAFTFLHWAVVLGATALILALIGWQLALLYAVGRLWVYLGALAGLILLVWAVAHCVRRTRYFHFHHYLLGLLAPFFPVPGPVSSVAQAILIGIAIEGLTRWGPDPVFIRHKTAELLPSVVEAATAPPPLPPTTPAASREERVAGILRANVPGGGGGDDSGGESSLALTTAIRVAVATQSPGGGGAGGGASMPEGDSREMSESLMGERRQEG